MQPASLPGVNNLIKASAILIAFGAFALYFFYNITLFSVVLIVSGLVLFAIWVFPYFQQDRLFKSRPGDSLIDEWLLEDLNENVRPIALDRLKIREKDVADENIIIIPYPIYWPAKGVADSDILSRVGGDGFTGYSIWKVQVLVLAEKYISYYSCNYNWLSNSVENEQSNEFFYTDIASVKTDLEHIRVTLIDTEANEEGQKEPTELEVQTIRFVNMSSDNFTIITEIPELNTSDATKIDVIEAVQAIRVMLRDIRAGEKIEFIVERNKEETILDENGEEKNEENTENNQEKA